MKRNSLTTAVVAGIAGVAGFAGLANAVDLNPDGLGQVLLYPYYTVNKGQDTMISVVNTADVGKAVKVRFLEGYNSREVLDFNLFLSPHDVWTAGVTSADGNHGETGGGKMVTTDRSCVYPPEVAASAGVAFRDAAYTGKTLAPFNEPDKGPQTIERTREGYLELISMGDIVPGSDLDATVTHAQTGNPDEGVPECDRTLLNSTPVMGTDLVPPTGGLFGAGAIVNVGEGTYFNYNADAIDGFTARKLWFGSSALEPSLQNANSAESLEEARAYIFINGQLLVADYGRGIDAVSAIFMSDAIYNEYNVDTDLHSNTDWVVTFPTKRFYVDQQAYPTGIIKPFQEAFHAPGQALSTVSVDLYDREEGFSFTDEGISPPIVGAPSALPYEVNVISFLTSTSVDEPSGVLGSILRPNIPPYGKAGWLRLGFDGHVDHVLDTGVSPDQGAVSLVGLPATGFMAYNLINENANPGLLANYSGAFRHRASRSCSAETAGGACS